jgi:hypothetical protein
VRPWAEAAAVREEDSIRGGINSGGLRAQAAAAQAAAAQAAAREDNAV